MSIVAKLWAGCIAVIAVAILVLLFLPDLSSAKNINQYRDTISDSAPSAPSNHTFEFIVTTDVAPGARLEFTPPAGFSMPASAYFDIRNVQLTVNGNPRTAGAVAGPGVDQIEITNGAPGFIRYTLAPDSGLTAGDAIEFKIGNHTLNSLPPSESFSTTTGTTTYSGDIEPIINSATLGTHEVKFEIWDGVLVANAGFLISINNRVRMPNIDTTEEVPPYRFNPAPTSTVGGTTLSVEISLETDEFAICRYSRTPGVSYNSMTNNFSNTGIVFHSTVVTVVPDSVQTFYVRCIDDENNFNIDDFIIEFTVNPIPDGLPNGDGDTDGDGSGTGDGGTGGGSSGSGGGGSGGSGSGNGGGSGGGGGGGGRGDQDDDGAGGGFESDDEPYQSGDARVVISGFAFPNSTVSVGVDGKLAQTTRSNGSGAYSVTLDKISRGVYTFGVYAEGADKIKSSTFSTSFTVTGGRTSELTNINVSPSIKVSPNPVDPGQTLTVTGYALPNSTVTIQTGKQKSKSMAESTAEADSSGKWSTTISTSNFTRGTNQIRAKAAQSGGATSNYSEYTYYGVGEESGGDLNADLNRDGRVNLTDFSILLFWWNGTGGDSNPPADINRDGRVTLTDFSILLFNWTG